MAIRPNTKGKYAFSVFVLLPVTVLLSVQGHAQVPGATLAGIVTDPASAIPLRTTVLPNQTDIFDADGTANNSAGQLTSTVTDAREVQLGLKVIW